MRQHDTGRASNATGFDTAKFQQAFLSELRDAGMIGYLDGPHEQTTHQRKNENTETMATHEFEKLDDDELRERVLENLETIEKVAPDARRRSAGNQLRDEPSGHQALNELKELFGADGTTDEPDTVEWI